MKRPQLIVGILAASHFILALSLVFILKYWMIDEPEWLGYPLFMLFASQGTLLGIWTALGYTATPWRVMFSVIGIVLFCHFLENKHLNLFFAVSSTLFVGQAINSIALLLILHFLGLELRLPSEEKKQSSPFQFTIRQMLAWTTTLAVTLSAFHYMPPRFFSDLYRNAIEIQIFSSLAVVGTASVWLAFGNRWLMLRISVLLIAIGLGIAILTLFHLMDSWWPGAIFLVLEAIWTIGSLAIVRWAGYQMTWHWRLRWRA